MNRAILGGWIVKELDMDFVSILHHFLLVVLADDAGPELLVAVSFCPHKFCLSK